MGMLFLLSHRGTGLTLQLWKGLPRNGNKNMELVVVTALVVLCEHHYVPCH